MRDLELCLLCVQFGLEDAAGCGGGGDEAGFLCTAAFADGEEDEDGEEGQDGDYGDRDTNYGAC